MKEALRKIFVPFMGGDPEVISEREGVELVRHTVFLREIDIFPKKKRMLKKSSKKLKQKARERKRIRYVSEYSPEEWITTRQAYAETNIGMNKLRQLCKKEAIRTKKEGRSWLILVRSLNSYIEQEINYAA